MENLDIEEVFLDPHAKDLESIEYPIDKKNIKFIEKMCFFLLITLIVWTAYLQIIKGDYYTSLSEKNYTRTIVLKAQRGIIYDKNLKQIVFNVPSFDLVVTAYDFFKDRNKTFDEKIEELSKAAKIDKNKIKEKIKKAGIFSFEPLLVSGNIEKEKALIIKEKIKNIAGASLEINANRNYIDSRYFSNVIGYTGRVDEKDLKNHSGYILTDTIGKNGLEMFYENQLRGKYGKLEVEVDSFGKTIKTIKKNDPLPGNNLVLNVDSELQKKIYDEFEKAAKKSTKNNGAAAVAIDPRNGAILALVSFPSFDNNLFAKGMSSREYKKLINDSSNPFFNRPISGEYPPGSTIKPLIGAAALEEKIVSPSTTIMDYGVIYVGSYKFLDWKAHGKVNLVKAIAQSCNVYFYTVGGGYRDIKGLGIEKINKYAKLFGLGKKLGIDIPEEKDGFIPNKEWKKNTKNENWYIGDTYNTSIGQGYFLVTPIQIASYVSFIANGGKLYQPQIVDKILDANGNLVKDIKPKIIRENFIKFENIKYIQKGMRENVVSGSGRLLNSLKIKAAGKTGTAQHSKDKNPHAWYVSYAPYENPEIVLAVVVEEGGEGHLSAVPIVKNVFEWYFSQAL